MIEIWSVAANGLWILGLAIILAGLSWAHWIAREEQRRFRSVLSRPGIQRTIDLGLLLFCAGLAATSRALWERVLWGLLGLAWIVQAWLAGRRGAKK